MILKQLIENPRFRHRGGIPSEGDDRRLDPFGMRTPSSFLEFAINMGQAAMEGRSSLSHMAATMMFEGDGLKTIEYMTARQTIIKALENRIRLDAYIQGYYMLEDQQGMSAIAAYGDTPDLSTDFVGYERMNCSAGPCETIFDNVNFSIDEYYFDFEGIVMYQKGRHSHLNSIVELGTVGHISHGMLASNGGYGFNIMGPKGALEVDLGKYRGHAKTKHNILGPSHIGIVVCTQGQGEHYVWSMERLTAKWVIEAVGRGYPKPSDRKRAIERLKYFYPRTFAGFE